MKTAIVHDWLTGMRGGEKCLEVMCELFPDAVIHTLIHLPGRLSARIEGMEIRTSWLQRLPGREKYYRHLLPLFPAAVESFNLSSFDLVISSSHCVAKGAVTRPEALHLCYCYTPMRYVWDQYEHYFGSHRLRPWDRLVIPPLIKKLRRWDIATSPRVNSFAAISGYVSARIMKYYGREARVIYPPVDVEAFSTSSSPGSSYLMVNALAPYKRVDLAVEAFNELGLELRIVGTGQDQRRLEAMAGPTIRFLGWVSQEELAREYRDCRALVFPGEEDFGITPLEALASGRPVVAFGRGGVTETVKPHPDFPSPNSWPREGGRPTGVFFTGRDAGSLVEAVRFFEARAGDFDPAATRESALPFNRSRFREELSAFIDEELSRKDGRRQT